MATTKRSAVAPAAWLALADGTVWEGRPFGHRGRRTGEVVFNTCMTGYQEVLTDPSYSRQIVIMTAPHIGNTGVNDADDESDRAWVAGFAIRHPSEAASSWRATDDLGSYLDLHCVPGIRGLDTRALVRRIRSEGAMPGALVADGGGPEEARALARAAADMNAMDLVGEVSCRRPYTWSEPAEAAWYPLWERGGATPTATPHVVVVDMGVKRNTLRMLASRGCRVTVVPARLSAEKILALAPDGVLLSNGPGDPARLGDITENARRLFGRVPVFGICLGLQVLGLALGGRTYKLKFGHRGGNQPVQDVVTGAVAITSHNHGYALAAESLPTGVTVTHVNLNDACVEGLAAPALRVFGVQYHPEAAPGPHDADALFDAFLEALTPPPAAWAAATPGVSGS